MRGLEQQGVGEGAGGAGQQLLEVDGGLELARELAHHVSIVRRILQKDPIEGFLEARHRRLEERQRHDQEHRLEHARVRARDLAHEPVEAPHHQQVDADQRRGGRRVEDAAPRQQVRVQELVAHDRVGDRARTEGQGGDGETEAQARVELEVEQTGNRGREAVADQTRAEADPDHAHLLLQARNPRAPVAVEQEPHGREPEPEVDEREQRLMDQQEDVQEHAEDAGHRGQVAQRADLGDREVGLPQRHRQHQHEVEQAMNPIDPKRPGSTRLRRAKARSSGKTLANANRDGKKNSQT